MQNSKLEVMCFTRVLYVSYSTTHNKVTIILIYSTSYVTVFILFEVFMKTSYLDIILHIHCVLEYICTALLSYLYKFHVTYKNC